MEHNNQSLIRINMKKFIALIIFASVRELTEVYLASSIFNWEKTSLAFV